MNIVMAVTGLVGLKRAPECIKMHHFDPPHHISGYGPGLSHHHHHYHRHHRHHRHHVYFIVIIIVYLFI